MLRPAFFRWFPPSLVALGLLLAAPGASAQDDPRALFRQGQAAYETGDYDTAVRSWERAYEIDARPLLQYNLAQAYERLGQLDRAVAAYRLYLQDAPADASEVLTARARLASLEQRLGNTSIVLSGGPEGATILIDGEDRGRTPHPDPFRTTAGSHRIVVRAPGYEDFVATVAVSAGQSARVEVEMTPLAARSEAPREGGEQRGGDGGISTVGIVVASVGGAILIGGAITGGLALSAAQSAPSDVGPEADEARTLATVTDVLLPVGAVTAVTGIVLMFVLGGDGEQASAVAPSLGPGHAGVVVRGSF